MKYLFLDSNIYLHYQDYEQLPWSDVLYTTEGITIVVPPITRREIDKIKDHGKGKISNKARDVSKRFRDVFLDDVVRSIPMIVCNAPKPSDYEKYDFDKEIQDDQFILSVLLFQKQNECEVIVIASDTNPLITAKSYGLPALYLDDKYRLAPELSNEEKELIKTKKELDRYKNRISEPTLTFEGGETFIKVNKPVIDDPEPIVRKLIAEELINNPFIRPDDKPVNDPLVKMTSIAASGLNFMPKPAEIQRYNNELIEYYKEYEDHVQLKISRDILTKQIHEIKFELSNNGNAPTGSLDIFINFPKTVKVYDSTSRSSVNLNIPPLKPDPPSGLPMSPLFTREMRKKMHYLQHNQDSLTPYGYIDHRPQMWDLNKTVSQEYHFCREPLPQTLYYDNLFDYGIYVDLMQCGNFSIEYTIVDTSLPVPVKGELKFILE